MTIRNIVQKVDKNRLIDFAKEQGFWEVKFAKAEPVAENAQRYKEWVSAGYHAQMEYLNKNFDKKADPELLLAGAKTVIVLSRLYKTPYVYGSENIGQPGKISRYAWGDDYHDVLKQPLIEIKTFIHSEYGAECVSYVDTGPTLDRVWAEKSGMAWQGKNGMAISPVYGSYFFIAIIITTLEIEPDSSITGFCGNCQRCVKACPTGAIIQDKVVDSNKCLSYWNIEAKPDRKLPDIIKSGIGDRVYGCDICQEVCPWNSKKIFTEESAFFPRNGETELDLNMILNLSKEEFSQRFRKTPIKRTKLEGLQRSAKAIVENNEKLT